MYYTKVILIDRSCHSQAISEMNRVAGIIERDKVCNKFELFCHAVGSNMLRYNPFHAYIYIYYIFSTL